MSAEAVDRRRFWGGQRGLAPPWRWPAWCMRAEVLTLWAMRRKGFASG